MSFLEILRFEVDDRLRRLPTWMFFAAFIALAWFISAGVLVGEAERAGGELHVNGPAGVAVGQILIGMIGLIITAAIFGGAALRDRETPMDAIFATLPITKTDYLGGRFLGAFIVNVLLITAAPFALMLFTQPPFVKSELVGPFRIAAYLQPYALFMVPNVFITGAILFAIAVLTRRSLPVFAAAAFLFLGALVVEEVVAETMGLGELASLIEPFGFVGLSEQWEFWTPHEKNTRLVMIDRPLLWNRLLWFGAGALILTFTRFRFRMEARIGHGRRRTAERNGEAHAPVSLSLPAVSRSFDFKSTSRQAWAIAIQSFRDLAISRDFLIIALLLAIMAVVLGSNAIGDNFGVPFWPLTQFIAPFLGSFLIGTTIALLTTFYAGELIWREREAGLSDIADANPVPDWAVFVGKFAALALMLVALQTVLMLSGLLLQAGAGYFNFEIGLYLQILFGLKLADYLLLAALAMLVHVVVDNKYLGHLIVVICHLFTIFSRRFGISHNLLVYGRDSGWVYSDISGFGPFLGPVLWFKLYWGAWALLLAVTASLFWMRGRDRGFRKRLTLARLRFRRAAKLTTAAAVVLIAGVGGYIFYNTNVLARYRTPYEAQELRAEYERRYGKYENDAQPVVTGTKLHVEIHPDRRVVDVRGRYALVNVTAQPIRTIHLFLNPEVQNRTITFDRTSRVVVADDELGHRTYELARALEPGGSLQMNFDVRFEPRGFPNSDPNTSVVRNGTYFDHTGGRRANHRRWLPLVGYQRTRELAAARTRRLHGLAPRPLAASLEDITGDNSAGRELITFEAVIGTAADQIAIAPGTLRRSWTENGRRYFHYATEGKVKNAFAIFSSDYAVHEETWKGVTIELFHHPKHTFNLQRFARSVRASLDYYEENFGPYPHRHIRIAEFPRYANLAHAYPGTISYAETTGWVTRVDESAHFDLPSMTVAHEVAHQWWGFQVTPAAAEGAATVSEVLAQYSALMVIGKLYGPEMVRRFLSNTRIEYLNRRGTPEHPEVPLLRVTEHPNLVYRKGPLAMYALRQYVGEEPVNAALRRLLETYGSGRPPYATSLDLYRELKQAAPAAYHYLLEDLLETITLWNLRTRNATAIASGKGTWLVTIDIEAEKLRADGSGRESEVPMNDFVEIGVFGAAKSSTELGAPLYLRKHRIRSGRNSIMVVVNAPPLRAGIDPYLHLIDRNWTDNTRPLAVSLNRGK